MRRRRRPRAGSVGPDRAPGVWEPFLPAHGGERVLPQPPENQIPGSQGQGLPTSGVRCTGERQEGRWGPEGFRTQVCGRLASAPPCPLSAAPFLQSRTPPLPGLLALCRLGRRIPTVQFSVKNVRLCVSYTQPIAILTLFLLICFSAMKVYIRVYRDPRRGSKHACFTYIMAQASWDTF